MKKKVNVSRFDAAEHLRDENDIAAYLTVVLEENDPSALADALGTVARARHERHRKSRRAWPRITLQSVACRCVSALRYHSACDGGAGREADGDSGNLSRHRDFASSI